MENPVNALKDLDSNNACHRDGLGTAYTGTQFLKQVATSYVTATTIFADGGIMQSSPGLSFSERNFKSCLISLMW
jgi:hypothetical protein